MIQGYNTVIDWANVITWSMVHSYNTVNGSKLLHSQRFTAITQSMVQGYNTVRYYRDGVMNAIVLI